MQEFKNPEFLVFLKTGANTVAQVVMTQNQNRTLSIIISAVLDQPVKLAPVKLAPEKIVLYDGGIDYGLAEHDKN
jgi:hypothetical protein